MTMLNIRHMLAKLGQSFHNQPLMDLIPTRAHRYNEALNFTPSQMLGKIKSYLSNVLQGRMIVLMASQSPKHAKYVIKASRVAQGRYMFNASHIITKSTKVFAALGIIYQNLIDSVYMSPRGQATEQYATTTWCKLEWKDNMHTAEAKCLLRKPYIKEKEGWVKEIKIMLDKKLLLNLDCL
ncbi:hypothetical protein ACFX2I_023274 [Malus domestica]